MLGPLVRLIVRMRNNLLDRDNQQESINIYNMEIRHLGMIISRSKTKRTREYLDQLRDDKDKWIPSTKIQSYLRDRYGLSLENYYKLVMGLTSNPKCAYCGSNTPFKGLAKGYARCCSRSHDTSYRNLINNPSTINGSPMKGKNHSKEAKIKNAKWHATDFEYLVNSAYGRFIKLGSLEDKCYIYIAHNNGKLFKVGITSTPKNRSKVFGWFHVVRSSNRLTVATIERDLKLMFRPKLHEWYDWKNLRKVLNFIGSSTTIHSEVESSDSKHTLTKDIVSTEKLVTQ